MTHRFFRLPSKHAVISIGLVGLFSVNTFALTRISSSRSLSANIYDNVEITANNVNLDLNGYSIIGSGSGTGVLVSGKTGVTIRSSRGYGYIQNFATGIQLLNGSGHTVNKIVAERCVVGINVNASSSAKLNNSYANSNTQEGITIRDANSLSLYMMNANYNGRDGFDQNRGSSSNINHLNTNYNAFNGLEMDEVKGFYLTTCTNYDNGQHGLSLSDYTINGTVNACNSSSNTTDGVHVRTGSKPITFQSSYGTGNGDEDLDDNVGGNTYNNCYYPKQ